MGKMADKESLEVSPQELAFKVTPDNYSTKQLRLTNRSAKIMAFKIKTTNPKQYFVRPNQGLIKSGDRVIIHVMMGKMPEVPKEKCKDRFLVQSAPYDGPLDQQEKFEWRAYYTPDKFPPPPNGTFKPDEVKLKCSYIQPVKEEDDNAPRPKIEPTPQEPVPELVNRKPTKSEAPTPKPAEVAKPISKAAAAESPKKSTTVAHNEPTVAAGGPQYTIYLMVALLFFFIGRYTVHIDLKIPGLE